MKASIRQLEIVDQYSYELKKHMSALKSAEVDQKFEIKDFAALLFIHPTHLSNTIFQVLGKSPCDIYQEKLIEISKELILASPKSINSIAKDLTFDPSNFTRFFKRHAGTTPQKFREMNANGQNSELLGI
jgi:AraC family transcriptional regulator, regulatory protein of adaptative response / methylphosphotriester-DNA alkyltransferase methyltransferase